MNTGTVTLKESIWEKTSTKIALLLAVVGLVFIGIAALNYNSDNNNQANASMQTITQDNGLIIEDTKIGDGQEIKPGDTVTMHYTGYLEDGTVFDSSKQDNREPFSFTVGAGQVITGWEEGVPGMKVGGERILTIPSDLAYGDFGIPGAIPPKATLKFEIEALSVQ